MKILAFVDLHGNLEHMETLRKKAAKADIILCAGDISIMERNLSEMLSAINEFDKPVLLIHGNHEDEGGLKAVTPMYENLIFLHKGVHHKEDVVFMGYGGGGFSHKDEEFEDVANNFFKAESEGKTVVLMTHAPPYNTQIDKVHGSHRGNASIKKFIDEIEPTLVIAGHLHETAGIVERVGKSTIINPGPKGQLIDI